MEELLISVLPIIGVIIFWVFLMRKMKNANPVNQLASKQDSILKELVEIKELLKELNSRK